MKRFTLVFSLLAIIGFTACENERTDTVATLAGGDGLRFAYVNNDTLLTYYDYYTEQMEELDATLRKAEKQLQQRAMKFEQEAANFQKQAQAGLLSKNQLNSKQVELMQKQTELQNAQQAQAQGLRAQEQEKKQMIYNKIKDYVKQYSQTKGYDVVLGYTEGPNMWYAADAMDVTQEILGALNDEYREMKKTSATEAGTEPVQ